jgi:hypothetical protein
VLAPRPDGDVPGCAEPVVGISGINDLGEKSALHFCVGWLGAQARRNRAAMRGPCGRRLSPLCTCSASCGALASPYPERAGASPSLTTHLRCSFRAVTDFSRAARRASQEGTHLCIRSHNDEVAPYGPRQRVGRSSRAMPGSTTNDTLRGHAKRSSRATGSRWRTATSTRNTTFA